MGTTTTTTNSNVSTISFLPNEIDQYVVKNSTTTTKRMNYVPKPDNYQQQQQQQQPYNRQRSSGSGSISSNSIRKSIEEERTQTQTTTTTTSTASLIDRLASSVVPEGKYYTPYNNIS